MNKPYKKTMVDNSQQTIKFFDNLLRASTDGIVITDATHNIIVVNEAFCDFLGQQRCDVIETNLFYWLEQCDTGAMEKWIELENHIYYEGYCQDAEFRFVTEKHGIRYLSVNASLLERVASEDTGVVISIWRDITEQKMNEEELRVLNKYLEQIVEERTAELAKLNRELWVENMERKRAEEMLRKINSELDMRIKERTAKLTETNKLLNRENARYKEAEEKIKRNVSERRRLEAMLLETNQTLHAIVHALPVAIVVLDSSKQVKIWNPSAEHIFGWAEQEVIGHTLPFAPESNRDEILTMCDRVLRGESVKGVKVLHRRQDGSSVDVNISAAPLSNTSGNVIGIVALVADITEHKQAKNNAGNCR